MLKAKKLIKYMGEVVAGKLITKEKRQEMFGRVAGGSGSSAPEEYQRSKIVEKTGIPCPKTNLRINLRTFEMKELAKPNMKQDGFDYSEDFDGCQTIDGKKIYINLKCIVGAGGAQTRSLREVYWFVDGQLNILKNTNDVYFANILDGDEADSNINKFEYIKNLYPEEIQSKVYVGDLLGYFNWFAQVRDWKQ